MRVHIEANLIGVSMRKSGGEMIPELKLAVCALLDRMQANASAIPGVHQLIGSEGIAFGSVTFHGGRNQRPVVSMVHTADIDRALRMLDEVCAASKRSPALAAQANKLTDAAKVLREMLG